MERIGKVIREFSGMKQSGPIKQLTIPNLRAKMKQFQFDERLREQLIDLFQDRIERDGEDEFQHWLFDLSFSIPEELEPEQISMKMYENYQNWIEKELVKLESETKLSWEKQAEDIQHLNSKARKAQLVIRHRLAEVVLTIDE